MLPPLAPECLPPSLTAFLCFSSCSSWSLCTSVTIFHNWHTLPFTHTDRQLILNISNTVLGAAGLGATGDGVHAVHGDARRTCMVVQTLAGSVQQGGTVPVQAVAASKTSLWNHSVVDSAAEFARTPAEEPKKTFSKSVKYQRKKAQIKQMPIVCCLTSLQQTNHLFSCTAAPTLPPTPIKFWPD